MLNNLIITYTIIAHFKNIVHLEYRYCPVNDRITTMILVLLTLNQVTVTLCSPIAVQLITSVSFSSWPFSFSGMSTKCKTSEIYGKHFKTFIQTDVSNHTSRSKRNIFVNTFGIKSIILVLLLLLS